MGLKKRFRPKEIVVKDSREKEKLKVLKENPTKSNIVDISASFLETKSEIGSGDLVESDKQARLIQILNVLYNEKNLNLFQVMNQQLELLCDSFESNTAILWMVEENERDISSKVAFGSDKDLFSKKSFTIGQGLVGWSVEKSRSCLVEDSSLDERVDPAHDLIVKTKDNTTLIIPLIFQENVLGALQLIGRSDGEKFSQPHKRMLESIGSQTSLYINSLRAKRSYKEIQNRLKTFRDLNEDFSSTLDLDKLLGIVLTKGISLLRAEVGSIWLLEENGEGIECHVAEGPTKDKVIGVKIKAGVGIVGWVVENREPIIVEDCSKDARFSKAMDKKIGFVTESMITVPLLVKGECIGAIQIINKKGEGSLFDREDLDLMGLFASSSAMYIKNARLFSAETKAKELSALIEISKEITSTLDLDSVLMSIVNLSSNIIDFERAGISLLKRGSESELELKSISGVDVVDRTLQENKSLEHLHNSLSKSNPDLRVNNVELFKKSDSYNTELENYMIENKLKSFRSIALKDDQGLLGFFTMDGGNENIFNDSKEELLSILISQSTVALRNASLYDTIPSSNVVAHIKDDIFHALKNYKDIPKEKVRNWSLGVLASVLFLVFAKIPNNINTNIEIIPSKTIYYSKASGNIEKVHVVEGEKVSKGQLLVEMDVKDDEISLQQKEASERKAFNEMLKLKSENKIADYKIKENEWKSLRLEVTSLRDKIKSKKLYAQSSGFVVSEDLDSLVGKPVKFAQELIQVASKEKYYIQFEVPEANVGDIEKGMEAKFKVYGLPNESFDGLEILSIAGEGKPLLEGETDKYFKAKAVISNAESLALIKPGMTGRGKIRSHWKSVGGQILKPLLSFLALEVFF